MYTHYTYIILYYTIHSLTYNCCARCTCDLHHCIDTIRLASPHLLSNAFGWLWTHPHRIGSVNVVSLSYFQLMSADCVLGLMVRDATKWENDQSILAISYLFEFERGKKSTRNSWASNSYCNQTEHESQNKYNEQSTKIRVLHKLSCFTGNLGCFTLRLEWLHFFYLHWVFQAQSMETLNIELRAVL